MAGGDELQQGAPRGPKAVEFVNGQAVQEIVLTEGDKIANVVYDPNMVYKFFIYGDFDLDRTGQPAPADKRRLATYQARR